MSSTPPPSTATVPLSSAPSCAAASIPLASPDVTIYPPWPRSRARARAKRWPAALAMRAPTTATERACNRPASPKAHITGGGGSMAASWGGNAASHEHSSLAPRASPASSSRCVSAGLGTRGGAARPARSARRGRAPMARAASP